jgi:serine/threonine protein kinase
MSPEVYESDYTYSSDIWSIGVNLYFLFSKTSKVVDFKSKDKKLIDNKINPLNYQFGKEYIEIIRSCLEFDPLKRPTVLELLEKFEYFLQNMKSDVKIESNEEINDFVIPGAKEAIFEGDQEF